LKNGIAKRYVNDIFAEKDNTITTKQKANLKILARVKS